MHLQIFSFLVNVLILSQGPSPRAVKALHTFILPGIICITYYWLINHLSSTLNYTDLHIKCHTYTIWLICRPTNVCVHFSSYLKWTHKFVTKDQNKQSYDKHFNCSLPFFQDRRQSGQSSWGVGQTCTNNPQIIHVPKPQEQASIKSHKPQLKYRETLRL